MEFQQGQVFFIGSKHAYDKSYLEIVGKQLTYHSEYLKVAKEHLVDCDRRTYTQWLVHEDDLLPIKGNNTDFVSLLREE